MDITVVDVNCPQCGKPIIAEVKGPNRMVYCIHCRSSCSLTATGQAPVRELTAQGKCDCGRYLQIVDGKIETIKPLPRPKPQPQALVGIGT